MWKGDPSGSGNYSHETVLTPANVNVNQFGKIGEFKGDGNVLAQPLYVPQVDINGTKHNIVIFATEHDSVYAYDVDSPTSPPLWERHYAVNGATPAPDNYGGRTTVGGEIGITGTPVIDPATGFMYFVTMLVNGGATEQWLRMIDIRTGTDVAPGSVKIAASVPGDGRGSANGQIAFDPLLQNQRAGLVMAQGQLIIAWGSFSDWGLYHGWLMAYDPKTLTQTAAFVSTPQFQQEDDAFGPADFGGGGANWMGGAKPSVDDAGNIYLVDADGSFNAQKGGNNYGDTVMKLQLQGGAFHIVDYFTPANQSCVNPADLEIGSGGVAIVNINGRLTGLVIEKVGQLYVLDLNNMGKFNASADQVPQVMKIGNKDCFTGMGAGFAEGPDWQRLYGNVAFFGNSMYVGASSSNVRQYTLSGSTFNPTPAAVATDALGMRGANMVVSSNGTTNGIVWAYNKNASEGRAVLTAYDATSVAKTLWDSGMNPTRDVMHGGFSFGVPVVADGRVFAAYEHTVAMFGVLK